MCGIAGWLDRSMPRVQAAALLPQMLDRIAHRGPDERGLLIEPELGLYAGMQRLSIIDLAHGQQPIWNEDGTIGVLFNGEIYNYVELRAELVRVGHHFRTESDTEVLVHLYEEYGNGMCSRLRGMFAFAIVDRRRRRIFLARDHFGQKPLYYFLQNSRLAFASEMKALFALPFVDATPDLEAYLDYVSWYRLPSPATHFSNVRKLQAGHFLECNLDSLTDCKATPYWDFRFDSISSAKTFSGYVDELETVLKDSVKVHLRSDVPIGIMLSGGLDSRTIAEIARPLIPGQLTSFSVVFDGEESERDAASSSAQELGTIHREVEVSSDDLENSISEVAWLLDEPVADPAAFAVLKLCRFAREHVKVLLGGEGADELFGGYAERYQGIASQISRSNYLRKLSPLLRFLTPSNTTRIGRAVQRSKRSYLEELVAARSEGFPSDVKSPWLLNSSQLERIANRQSVICQNLVQPTNSPISDLQSLDIRWQLAESLLQKSDKMSMGASLELRCPFLDVEVANVAKSIPEHFRIAPTGPGKLVLRGVLKKIRPDHCPLPKKGFPIPLDRWLKGPLRERVHSMIFSAGSRCVQAFDANNLRNAWNAFLNGAQLSTEFYALWLYEEWTHLRKDAPLPRFPEQLTVSELPAQQS